MYNSVLWAIQWNIYFMCAAKQLFDESRLALTCTHLF
jgi:hypothetical protein